MSRKKVFCSSLFYVSAQGNTSSSPQYFSTARTSGHIHHNFEETPQTPQKMDEMIKSISSTPCPPTFQKVR